MVSENFEEKWKTALLNAEKDLVRLLLVDSDKVIAKIEFKIESNLKKEDLFNFKKNYQLLEKKHGKYRGYLKERHDRKWKKFKVRYKSNLLTLGISENESTSSFQAMSEKEKTTNRAKQLQEPSELNSVAEKPNPSLVSLAKRNSNFTDNELSNSDVEIPLNLKISNTHEPSNIITNIGSTEGFAEGKSKKIGSSFVTDTEKQGKRLKYRKKLKFVENCMLRL